MSLTLDLCMFWVTWSVSRFLKEAVQERTLEECLAWPSWGLSALWIPAEESVWSENLYCISHFDYYSKTTDYVRMLLSILKPSGVIVFWKQSSKTCMFYWWKGVLQTGCQKDVKQLTLKSLSHLIMCTFFKFILASKRHFSIISHPYSRRVFCFEIL